MSTQLSFLDAPARSEVQTGRDILEDMAERRRLELDRLRRLAREYATAHGNRIHPDDLRVVAGIKPHKRTHQNPSTPNNILGAVFRVPYFRKMAEVKTSETPGSHGNPLPYYEYLPEKYEL